MTRFGDILRQHRRARGLTLAALAHAADTTPSYLSMIENHRVANPPSARRIDALERALGLRGELHDAARWDATPPAVRHALRNAADQARRGRELAEWLRASTDRRRAGGRGLDRLYRSGALRKRIDRALGPDTGNGRDPHATADHAAAPDQTPPPTTPTRPDPARAVPLINKVAAGYPRDFTDLDYPVAVADEYVPAYGVDDPDAFAATVVGDSMLPDYREGDIVVFSPAADVADGCDCFVRLEPDHDTTFKRVFFDADAGTIRLQPLNPRFPPQVLPRQRVSGLWRAVWKLSRV